MRLPILFFAALVAALALTACAPVTRVVMLPHPGHASVVEVTPRAPVKKGRAAPAGSVASGVKTTLLTKPYQAAAVETKNQVNVEQWNAARVKSRYGALLAAQPRPAQVYRLYFLNNQTQLTSESAAQVASVIARAIARPGNEIMVIGHADSVGTAEANDRLSLQRAQVIREAIIARGFDRRRIYAIGRGSRDLLVPTGDQVEEPRNRRVEITVR